jgi:hypothetical protein
LVIAFAIIIRIAGSVHDAGKALAGARVGRAPVSTALHHGPLDGGFKLRQSFFGRLVFFDQISRGVSEKRRHYVTLSLAYDIVIVFHSVIHRLNFETNLEYEGPLALWMRVMAL